MRVAALLLTVLLAAGCDDGFNPFVEDERAFALYGLLDARRDTQFVRVQDLQAPRDTVPDRLAARVTTTDLASGQTVEWRDSLVVLEDGSRRHLFFAPFRVEAARAYRLEARTEAGGAASAATVAVPVRPEVVEEPPVSGNNVVTQALVLLGVEEAPVEGAVTYRAQHVETGDTARVEVPYRAVRVSEGQRFLVELSRDADRMRLALGVPLEDSTSVALVEARLRFALAGMPTDVENGIGEVLAVGAFEHAWTLADSTLQALGLGGGR